MREILFRGKRKDNGDWIKGSFWDEIPNELGGIAPYGSCCFHHVDLGTVGQFTGLIDKNGKKVFEGDIFHLEDEIVGVIIFKDGCFRIETYGLRGALMEYGFDECAGGWGLIDCEPIDWSNIYDMEIIGNIHDNPKLMEGCV